MYAQYLKNTRRVAHPILVELAMSCHPIFGQGEDQVQVSECGWELVSHSLRNIMK